MPDLLLPLLFFVCEMAAGCTQMMTPGPSLYVLNKVTSNCSKIGNNDNALLEHAVYDDSPFETLFNLSEVRYCSK